MLPSHLLDPRKKKNEPPNRTRLGGLPPPLPPSLCVTGALSRIGRYRVKIGSYTEGNVLIDDNQGKPIILSYCIFRPRQLHDVTKPPLVCLHGGPSIPSNYLLPIVNGVTDRAIIFYDQWGCGKSSRPELLRDGTANNKRASYRKFSIPTQVEHLRQLIEDHWKLKGFHLLGHSFGGILAYEYLLMRKRRKQDNPKCQPNSFPCSLVLSSTPTSSEIIKSESHRLFRNLKNDGETSGDGATRDDDDYSYTPSSKQDDQSLMHSEEFRQTHECRLAHPPLSLMDAMAQMGPMPWRGIPAIDSYKVGDDDGIGISTLLIRGQYDFCTQRCMAGWKERLEHSEERLLPNCSHYAMLEDERLYGSEILRFVKSNDR